MKNIAVFASGNGTNYEAIAEAIQSGQIKANLRLLVVNKKDAYVLQRALKYHTEVLLICLKDYPSKEAFEQVIVDKLKEKKIDLICLAGYMLYCGTVLLQHYEGKIINIHPALLPAFKGAHGILDAYQYGVKVYGVTIHYVDAFVDHGKIIEQAAFHDEGYTLEQIEEKIHELEHKLYPEVIRKLIGEKDESVN